MDPNLDMHAAAYTSKGSPLDNCLGFICMANRTTRRESAGCVGAHKRVDALKFQLVVLSNDLNGNMYGPVGAKLSHATLSFFGHQ